MTVFPVLFCTLTREILTLLFDRGQTREMCEKQEKYFKGKVVTFTVQSLILHQYLVDLLTCWNFTKKSSKYLKMGKFGLVDAISQSIPGFCLGAKYLRVKKPFDVREMRIHLHATAIVYTLANVSTSI